MTITYFLFSPKRRGADRAPAPSFPHKPTSAFINNRHCEEARALRALALTKQSKTRIKDALLRQDCHAALGLNAERRLAMTMTYFLFFPERRKAPSSPQREARFAAIPVSQTCLVAGIQWTGLCTGLLSSLRGSERSERDRRPRRGRRLARAPSTGGERPRGGSAVQRGGGSAIQRGGGVICATLDITCSIIIV